MLHVLWGKRGKWTACITLHIWQRTRLAHQLPHAFALDHHLFYTSKPSVNQALGEYTSVKITQEERRHLMLEERRQRELNSSRTEQPELESTQRAESEAKELPQATSPPNSPVHTESTTTLWWRIWIKIWIKNKRGIIGQYSTGIKVGLKSFTKDIKWNSPLNSVFFFIDLDVPHIFILNQTKFCL